ncbi:hypothetical protein R3X27_19715 [Tropicimonas sp. TH_r6]|uniref:hypothetical protein n=1 Tax=Tropicimonas sp. TH_r6 TaxID=3082085 RepID=UPI0029552E64|nr:hypothetical protein [Tropicimonas sp. TH_r6]MDV7144914.1 hypothetical protein [Tropicimonas sp. TH_r6]
MRLSFIGSAILLSSSLAFAAGMEPWDEEGDWTILIDAENGNGCLANRQYDTGLIVEIGMDPMLGGAFFAAYNPEWTSIEDGAIGVVNFDFGDDQFAGEVVGIHRNGVPGGYAFFDNPEFATEFVKRTEVTVWGESEQKFLVDLSGSSKAVEAVKACQAEQPEPTAE